MSPSSFLSQLSPKTRFNRDVLWNVASLAVLGAGGIAVNVVITAWQGAEALGVFNQVYALYIMLSQISVGGLHYSALAGISADQNDRLRCADIAVSALLLGGATSLVVAAAAYGLGGWAAAILHSPGVAVGLALAAPGLIFFSLNKILLNVLNGMRCMRAYAVFQALRFVFLLAAVMALVIARQPSERLALSLTISEGALLFMLAAYVHVLVVPLRGSPGMRPWFRTHTLYGFRGFLSGFLTEMNTRVDVLMLGYFCNDDVVGIYSFAAIIAEGICQLPIVIRRNVDPIIGRCLAEKDFEKMRMMTRSVKRVTYGIMAAVCVVAVVVYPVALRWFVRAPRFDASWAVFAILLAGIVVNSGYRPFLGILLQGHRPGMNTLLVAAVVGGNAVMNAALIPVLGMNGAALATALAFVLEAFLLVVLARKLLNVAL